MAIQGFYMMPHPPIIIPEVGRGEELKISKTSQSMLRIGEDILQKKPSTIIIVSPHGTMFQDAVSLIFENSIHGSLENFRAPEVSMTFDINKPLTERIYEIACKENLPAVLSTNTLLKKYKITVNLDHGAMVPLYFVNKSYNNYKLVHITYAPLSDIELYKFGMSIDKAVKELNENTVFIASGDLSHRLKEDGPYEYSPFGEKFDTEFLRQLEEGNVLNLFNMDRKTIREAGECGRKSVFIMLGALEGKKFKGEILSYEGPFGVGYGVMKFDILSEDKSKLEELSELKKLNYDIKSNQKDPYVRLAIDNLTSYLNTGESLTAMPSYVTEEMKSLKRGVFVSLKKNGQLRGCIGTISPITDSIAQEIIRNSVDAAINDPRFNEVEKNELSDLDFSVDVLTEPEPAERKDLNPKIFGVIVTRGSRRGLLLPDLEGVDTVEEQLSIALRKAGIDPDQHYSIEKFKVVRHKEE